MDKRGNYLALCLLEALEDENISGFEKILTQYNADPNMLAFDRGIAPMHFTCGMDNLSMAEYTTEMLLNNKGDPNVKSLDEMTPLHVAALCGRAKIVRMLLERGGNIHAANNEKYTPFQYAIYECHFDVIETIKNFIFEQKIEKKKHLILNKDISPNRSITPATKRNNLLNIKLLEKEKFTPNRINYNYDVTSPYYINITHRRKQPLKINNIQEADITTTFPSLENDENVIDLTDHINEIDLSSKSKKRLSLIEIFNNDHEESRNLFELTEENLTELSKTMKGDPSRVSLIQNWREKVQRSKNRISILNKFNDIDSLLSGIMTNDTLDFTNTIIKSDEELREEKTPPRKSINQTAFGKLLNTLKSKGTSPSETSFITAAGSDKNSSKIILDDKTFVQSSDSKEFIYQMSEHYEHIDRDQGLIFFEEKRKVAAPPNNKLKIVQPKNLNNSLSSLSTTFSVPLDYDTETLRAELTQFGEPPGPITKSTKRLYTKRLIKYQKNPERLESAQASLNRELQNPSFSIELERTIRKSEWFNRISEYSGLEQQMSEQFKNNNTTNKKWREGNLKQSFIYLLIDPRISQNLSCDSMFIENQEAWKKFLSSIFYVGKGKSSRPYSHLYEALKLHSRMRQIPAPKYDNFEYKLNTNPTTIAGPPKTSSKILSAKCRSESKKVERIIDIWTAENGVICLHIFHNILPAEAYTREAAIIDALGLQHLTNLKRGDYYGPAQSWSMRDRKCLGVGLLFKAMKIFFAEGESQLYPSDLV